MGCAGDELRRVLRLLPQVLSELRRSVLCVRAFAASFTASSASAQTAAVAVASTAIASVTTVATVPAL